MSYYIQPLLSSNTFGEFMNRINDVIDEFNLANSVFQPNVMVRFDSSGSLSANTIDTSAISFSGYTINSIQQSFFTNNHNTLATSKAIYDLLTGGTALRLKLKANSINFGDGYELDQVLQVPDMVQSRYVSNYDKPITANAIYELLGGVRHPHNSFDLKPRQITLPGSDGAIYRFKHDFSDVSHSVVVSAKAIEDWLSGSGSPLDLKLGSLDFREAGSNKVIRIANNFVTHNDDETLITAKGIYELVGGADKDIRTLEGTSLKIKTHLIDSIRDDFTLIQSNTLPSTLAVQNYLGSGNYDLEIQANNIFLNYNVTANTGNISEDLFVGGHLFVGNTVNIANSLTVPYLSSKEFFLSNTANLFEITINAISRDILSLDDHTLATTNAIHKFLGSGNVESVSANTLFTLAGYSVNAITYMIDAANTNNTTIATTGAIYDLLTGAVVSVPPLPISANTFSFPGAGPGGNVVVNSIATDFTTINDTTLVTANAVYNLLTDNSLSARLNSLSIQGGQVVTDITTLITASTTNHNTLATTEAIKFLVDNNLSSGSAVISADEIAANDLEVKNLFTRVIETGGTLTGESLAQQTFSDYSDLGYMGGPYVYSAAIEAYEEKDLNSSVILLGEGGSSGTGASDQQGEARTIKIIAGGTNLTVNSFGVFINGAPVVTS